MRITKKIYPLLFSLLLLLSIFTGCGTEGGFSDSGPGNLAVAFTLPGGGGGYAGGAVVPAGVGSVKITISGTGMTTITDTFDVNQGATVNRSYNVPIGTLRSVSIDVYSGAGAAGSRLYTGSNTVDLIAGETAIVTVNMSVFIDQSILITILGGSNQDNAFSINPTSDSGSILAGTTYSDGAGSADALVVKLASNGSVDWQKTYGGTGTDNAKSVQETADGGYIVAGDTNSTGAGGTDIWILKLTSNGTVSWQMTYGGTGGDYAYSIKELSGGGYIVAGYTISFGSGSNDMWLLKLNSNGAVLWQKAIGGTGVDYGYGVSETADSGYIVAGYTNSSGAGNYDFWVLKLTSAGTVTWQRTYGGTGSDNARSIEQSADGGYIVAGYTNSFGAGGNDFWILKLTSTGSITWQKTFGDIGSDIANSVVETIDGGFVIAGEVLRSMVGAGDYDLLTMKLTSAGALSWQKTYGLSGNDHSTSLAERSDGSLLLGGYTSALGSGANDLLALSLDSSGDCAACLTGTPSLALSDSAVNAVTSSLTETVTSVTATDASPAITVAASTLTRTNICTLDPVTYGVAETTYAFDDITASATFIAIDDDDNATFDLPWSFTFYGIPYTTINIDTNGNIWFDNLNIDEFNFNLQKGENNGRVISVWNEDLFAEYYGSGVYAEAKTSPDRVVIRWEAETFDDYGSDLVNLFEAVLYRDGTIVFDYNYFQTNNCYDSGSGVSKGDAQDYTNLSLAFGHACTLAGRSFIFTLN